LDGEHSTAPLVRHRPRTSQTMHASQPPPSVRDRGAYTSWGSERGRTSRESHDRPSTGNFSLNLDRDTPRTLLQNYIMNSRALVVFLNLTFHFLLFLLGQTVRLETIKHFHIDFYT